MSRTSSELTALSVPAVIALVLVAFGVLSDRKPISAHADDPAASVAQVWEDDGVNLPLWDDPLKSARLQEDAVKRARSADAARQAKQDALDALWGIARSTTAGSGPAGQQADIRSACPSNQQLHAQSIHKLVKTLFQPHAVAAASQGTSCKGTVLDARTLMLNVCLRGKNEQESAEIRRRTRCAVIAALTQVGYMPEFKARLRNIALPNDTFPGRSQVNCEATAQTDSTSDGAPDNDGAPYLIPYELFRPEGHMKAAPADVYKSVVVLWWNDQRFRGPLVDAVSSVSTLLKKHATTQIDTCILGPSTSSALIEILRARLDPRGTTPPGGSLAAAVPCEPVIHLLLTTATMTSDRLIKLAIDLHSSRHGELSDEARKQHERRLGRLLAGQDDSLRIERTIGDDRELADAIIDELHLRDACPRDPAKHMVLITEADTHYGRSWYSIFATSLIQGRRAGQHDIERTGISTCNHALLDAYPHVHHYRYFNKLITERAESQKERPSEAVGTEVLLHTEPRPTDFPEGGGGMDYLNRLNALLLGRNEDLRRRKAGEISSIGVFGMSIYDKIAILNALRESFPRVVFFTDGIDARYQEPGYYHACRNLIVGSHYGLSVRPELQGENAPFRDGMRTSMYVACLKALHHASIGQVVLPPRPRVFELGRGFFFDLSGVERADPLYDAHPISDRVLTARTLRLLIVVVVALAIFGTLFLYPFSSVIQGLVLKAISLRFRLKEWLLVGGHLIVVGGLLGIIFVDHYRRDGEPFTWAAGISVWPTTILRAGAGIVALFYILRMRDRLQEDRTQLEAEFGLGGTLRRIPRGCLRKRSVAAWTGASWRCVRRRVRLWARPFAPLDGVAGGELDAQQLWLVFRYVGRRVHRQSRALIMAIMFFVCAMCVFDLVERPADPSRGEWARNISSRVLFGAVALQIYLVAFVMDATLFADHLLNVLRGVRVRWPETGAWAAHHKSEYQYQLARSEMLKCRFVVKHTTTIDNMIYYPFVVVFIMIAARHPVFDNWNFPTTLLLVFCTILSGVVYSGWILRRNAGLLRDNAIARISECIGAVRCRSDRGAGRGRQAAAGANRNEALVREMEEMRTEIAGMNRGALSGLSSTPILRALLIPFGGAGMIQWLSTFSPYLRAN